MRGRPFLALVVGLVVGLVPALVVANEPAPDQPDRTVLPLPEAPFKGKIDTYFKNSTQDWPQPLKAPKGAPNVLLILGDDIGFGHMSAFGGPANTPVFDRIAKSGLRYTDFHTTPVCAASRAALLTGRNGHSVGMGTLEETAAGFPGYNGISPPSAANVLEILRMNGYGTAWIGKADFTPINEITTAGPFDRWPTRGAEYFYGFFGPGVSQWYPPLWRNHTPVRPPRSPEEGYIFDADMADEAIGFIRRLKSIHPDKPWILYYAPSSAKPPVAAPKEFINKYRGKFDDGYDKLRERILARQIELGIVPPGTKLSPGPDSIPPWDELTDTDKKVGARWMEVFSGAVEHIDYQIGRVIESIEQAGDLDNTLIIYIAGDNGPTPEGGLHGIMNKLTYINLITESLDEVAKHMDDFGGPKSNGAYPAAWAYATSGAYSYGKFVTSGGGNSTAVAISWPARIKDKGGLRPQFTHLIDVFPTILEAAGVPAPKVVNGIVQKPIEGVSMVYTFDDAKAKDRHTTQYFELTGSRAMYQDGWWAGTRHGLDGLTVVQAKEIVPFDKDIWELYDRRNDFSLATDVAAKYPEKLKELQALFEREAAKYNVYPMADNLYEWKLTGTRPKLVAGNKVSYGPWDFRLPEEAVIDIKNRSFSIVAEVENADGKAEGMIVTCGGETGGYALMVQNGKPTFIYNWVALERYTITSPDPLPKGKNTIRLDFAYDGGGLGKGGTGTLFVNGRKVAEGRIAKTVPYLFSMAETFDVGMDWCTPVSPTYKVPFKFTGNIKSVTIEVKE
jgi:arylsulfatase A-like enzyme